MTEQMSGSNTRQSIGYLMTLASACAGLPFLGLGLGGALIGFTGGDPVDAFDVDGIVMFMLAFAVGFAMRLLFWPPAPALLRSTVRWSMTILFIAACIASLIGLALSIRLPATVVHRAVPIAFSCWALACQPGALVWLVRYRRDGL